ncbi:MAG: anti-sigma factor family protein [Kofleriaceae bacterium]
MSKPGRTTDDELLAAYCDGVAELSLEERKRVEALLASNETARTDEAATRSMIGALRDLPAEGSEPDWTAMERAIRAQVPDDVSRQWWRPVWRWLVLGVAVATIALFAFREREREEPVPDPIAVVVDAGVESPAVEHVAVHLDGEDFLLEAADDDLLDVDEMLLGEGEMDVPGLLSSDDLAWIDDLDDDDAAFAEQWLDERKKG